MFTNAIAISGSSGTGKGSAAGEVSRRLGFPIVSAGNIMRAEAERLGITLADLKKITKGDQFMDYWLDTATRLAIFEKTDGVIVEGRLVAFTVPSSVFRVLLVVEDEDGNHDHDTRYARIAKRDQLTHEEAKSATLYREENMDERYQKFYGIAYAELFNKKYYHLVVNTKTDTPEIVTDKIIEAFHKYRNNELKDAEHLSLPMF